MIILPIFATDKNFRNMIRNTDKRRAGDVPATAERTAATVAGTLDSCKAWGFLLLARRSEDATPSGGIDLMKKSMF
jgi:hypothetical protein